MVVPGNGRPQLAAAPTAGPTPSPSRRRDVTPRPCCDGPLPSVTPPTAPRYHEMRAGPLSGAAATSRHSQVE